MKALCAYWLDGYDWRKWEKELNRFPQFNTPCRRRRHPFLSRRRFGAVAEAVDPQPRLAGISVRIPPHHRQARASGKASAATRRMRSRSSCPRCPAMASPASRSGRSARAPRARPVRYGLMTDDARAYRTTSRRAATGVAAISSWIGYRGQRLPRRASEHDGLASARRRARNGGRDSRMPQAAAAIFEAEGAYFREQIDQAADAVLRDDGFARGRGGVDRGEILRLVRHPQRHSRTSTRRISCSRM